MEWLSGQMMMEERTQCGRRRMEEMKKEYEEWMDHGERKILSKEIFLYVAELKQSVIGHGWNKRLYMNIGMMDVVHEWMRQWMRELRQRKSMHPLTLAKKKKSNSMKEDRSPVQKDDYEKEEEKDKLELTFFADLMVIMGSCAKENVEVALEMEEKGMMKTIVELLVLLLTINEEDIYQDLVRKCITALKNMVEWDNLGKKILFEEERMEEITKLIGMSQKYGWEVVEKICSITGKCCIEKGKVEKFYQDQFAEYGTIERLITCLSMPPDSSSYGQKRIQEAALEGLAAMARENRDLAARIVYSQGKEERRPNSMIIMFNLLKDRSSNMRLAAATCLAYLIRCGVMEEYMSRIQDVLLTIVKLMNDSNDDIRLRAPFILAHLVEDKEELQKNANDYDALQRLSEILANRDNDFHASPKNLTIRKEGALTAIAAICSLKEECRKQIIEAKILPSIVSSLNDDDVRIRAAACRCARSLSRSVKQLRTSLLDAGISTPLFKLLSDSSVTIQSLACATLCNLVLDFSPMKKMFLENGGVEKLVELVHSLDMELKLNSVWALKNLLYQADSIVKEKVMNHLTYSELRNLLEDPDIGIQEQAVNLLRNLACGKDPHDVEKIFMGLGLEVLDLIEKRLHSDNVDLITQALYVIVNIATGTEGHKSFVMDHSHLLHQIIHLMDHEKAAIRTASIWCVLNLTWPEDSGANKRAEQFIQQGVDSKLKQMLNDPDLEVRDRSKSALEHFDNPPRMNISM